jgi:hypothetical protein
MITYQCDNCGKTDTTMAGWSVVRINLLFEDPNMPYPPGGTTLQETMPDYIFEKAACRDQWLRDHNLAKP